MQSWEERMTNLGARLINESVIVAGKPSEDDLAALVDLGEYLAEYES
jgi:hypothetical protein